MYNNFTKFLCLVSSILTACSFTAKADEIIRAEKFTDTGILEIEFNNETPDNEGVIKTFLIEFPTYSKGIYTAQDSRYDPFPTNGNRVLPWIFTPETLPGLFTNPAYGIDDEINPSFKCISMKNTTRHISRFGNFIQLRLDNGRILSILPLANSLTVSFFYGLDNGTIELRIYSFGTDAVNGKRPVLAWAIGENNNESSYKLFSMLKSHKTYSGNLRMRYEKSYPEMFRYLGWCTWEEYKTKISENMLVPALQQINDSELPIRYAIIDDGHLTSGKPSMNNKKTLASFNPNKNFPNGWSPLLAQRTENGLKWMGVWYNFNGYWGGFSSQNDFGEAINSRLRTIESTGVTMPKCDINSINTVYRAYLGQAAAQGIDFLKVDWQAANLYLLKDSENAAKQAFITSRTVDDIAHEYFNDAMINCMAINNIVLLNTYNVNITRTSIDYKLNNPFMAKEHLQQSFHNAMYMCPTVWGDHDMFHSSDKFCGEVMARSKAISGGPIYLSDAPDKIVPSMVWPLCYNDGEIIRPLAPGTVSQRSAFNCALTDAEPYYVSAPLPNNSVAVIAYNLLGDTESLSGSISEEDYSMAGTLMQPYRGEWAVPEGGLLIYDYLEESAAVLNKEYKFTINTFGDRLFLMMPIVKGWAVIGRTDKYLSPATVSDIKYGLHKISFTMHECAPFLFYMEDGTPVSDDLRISKHSDGIYYAEVISAEAGKKITIKRK